MIQDFYKEAKEHFDKLNKQLDDVEQNYKDLCSNFGEDPSKMSPEEFFGIFKNFWNQFQVNIMISFDINNQNNQKKNFLYTFILNIYFILKLFFILFKIIVLTFKINKKKKNFFFSI